MISRIILTAAFLAAGAASAGNVKTPLSCKIGAASGNGFAVAIKNTTGKTLKPETIVNLDFHWHNATFPNGEIDECWALDAPVAPGGMISHVTKLDRDRDPLNCESWLSSEHPAVVHANGMSETDCDNN
ncbi:MAG TPA: hypothetical protein VMH86_15970 [Rhizomicrobium sp.]|nr:hypothetical protein [Rhizomicrobium sp.]